MTTSNHKKLLQDILKNSGWSQEQLATKLGVTFATVNAWLNDRSQPRGVTLRKIQSLYNSTRDGKDMNVVYITLVGSVSELLVGTKLMLEKDEGNIHDDEAIRAYAINKHEHWDEFEEMDDSYENFEEEPLENDALSEKEEIKINSTYESDDAEFGAYVANSTNTVARGTQSAGRIYDKIGMDAKAVVEFVYRGGAIARIVDFGE